jgi:hypothetical protein
MISVSAQHISTGLYICLLIATVLFGSYIVDEIGVYFYEKQEHTSTKIFDLIHEFTPDLHEHEVWVNVIPVIILISFFLLKEPSGFQLAKEFTGKFLILLFIRTLMLLSTVLPKHEKCTRRFSWKNCFKGQCYDKSFSGHTALVFLACLIFLREDIIPFWGLCLIMTTQISLILLTRSHYTIDVVIALLFTYLVYGGDYHIFNEFVTKIEKEVTEVASEVSS